MTFEREPSGTSLTVGHVVRFFDQKAPFRISEDWDQVGLLVGDERAPVKGVMTTVNASERAVLEAENRGANLIICHHPPLFRAVTKLTAQSHPAVYSALSRGISILALHTNFDLARDGVAKDLASQLGVDVSGPVASLGTDLPSVRGKLILYVPHDAVDRVREAAFQAGGGRIGAYEKCSFSAPGEGTFFGSPGSTPAVGAAGRFERAAEIKLEMVVPLKKASAIIEAARSVHPYEEMAYDLFALEEPREGYGYGFMGTSKVRQSLEAWSSLVAEVFRTPSFQVVRAPEPRRSEIKKIAFSPGSASSFLRSAQAKGVDLYVCGEAGYHQVLEARAAGMHLLILGHCRSEIFFHGVLARWWREQKMASVPWSSFEETIYETYSSGQGLVP